VDARRHHRHAGDLAVLDDFPDQLDRQGIARLANPEREVLDALLGVGDLVHARTLS